MKGIMKRNIIVGLSLSVLVFLFANYAIATSGWNYKQRFDVNSTALLDNGFQVNITLDTQTLISGGKMNNDCSDLRIINSSETGNLTYWISTEQGKTCNTTTTRIWAKIPTLTAGNTTIYVYYGNPSATSESNCKGVFIYCEQANNGTKDNVWNYTSPTSLDIVGSPIYEGNGSLNFTRQNITGSNGANISTTSLNATPFLMLESYYYFTYAGSVGTNSNPCGTIYIADVYHNADTYGWSYGKSCSGSGNNVGFYNGATWVSVYSNYTNNTWIKLGVLLNHQNLSTSLYTNDNLNYTGERGFGSPISTNMLSLTSSGTDANNYFDLITLRNSTNETINFYPYSEQPITTTTTTTTITTTTSSSSTTTTSTSSTTTTTIPSGTGNWSLTNTSTYVEAKTAYLHIRFNISTPMVDYIASDSLGTFNYKPFLNASTYSGYRGLEFNEKADGGWFYGKTDSDGINFTMIENDSTAIKFLLSGLHLKNSSTTISIINLTFTLPQNSSVMSIDESYYTSAQHTSNLYNSIELWKENNISDTTAMRTGIVGANGSLNNSDEKCYYYPSPANGIYKCGGWTSGAWADGYANCNNAYYWRNDSNYAIMKSNNTDSGVSCSIQMPSLTSANNGAIGITSGGVPNTEVNTLRTIGTTVSQEINFYINSGVAFYTGDNNPNGYTTQAYTKDFPNFNEPFMMGYLENLMSVGGKLMVGANGYYETDASYRLAYARDDDFGFVTGWYLMGNMNVTNQMNNFFTTQGTSSYSALNMDGTHYFGVSAQDNIGDQLLTATVIWNQTHNASWVTENIATLRALAGGVINYDSNGDYLPETSTAVDYRGCSGANPTDAFFVGVVYAGIRGMALMEQGIGNTSGFNYYTNYANNMSVNAEKERTATQYLWDSGNNYVWQCAAGVNGFNAIPQPSMGITPVYFGIIQNITKISQIYSTIDASYGTFYSQYGLWGYYQPAGNRWSPFWWAFMDTSNRLRYNIGNVSQTFNNTVAGCKIGGVMCAEAIIQSMSGTGAYDMYSARAWDTAPYYMITIGQHYGLDKDYRGIIINNATPISGYAQTELDDFQTPTAIWNITYSSNTPTLYLQSGTPNVVLRRSASIDTANNGIVDFGITTEVWNAANELTVNITASNNTNKIWSEYDVNSSANVGNTLCGLDSTQNYNLSIDGSYVTNYNSNSSGCLSFNYNSGFSEVNFELDENGGGTTTTTIVTTTTIATTTTIPSTTTTTIPSNSTILSRIISAVAPMFYTSFFGSTSTSWLSGTTIALVFMYIIVIGIGIYSKMSFDSIFLLIGIVTIIGGATFTASGQVLTGLFMIITGIIVAIAVLRIFRH